MINKSTFPCIDPFSSAYYLLYDITVEYDPENTVTFIQDHLYSYIQENYYGSASTPILLYDAESNSHYKTEPLEDVRIDTVVIPEEGSSNNFGEDELLLAKPQYSNILLT